MLTDSEKWRVLHGDALAVLATMPSASVDALITDPPYSSGGAFRGDRAQDTTAKYVQSGGSAPPRPDFAGDNRDQRSFGYWCALWLGECLRIAKPGAVCAIFTDWRQLPILSDALQAGGWVWRGIIPWDKTEGVRPQMGRPRSQCEYVLWGSAGALGPREEVGVLPGVIREVRKAEDRHHIAGKPVEVMGQLARLCIPGGIVLDPFCGSASTGVGAVREGRRFVGIEVDPHWHAVALERMLAENAGLTLTEARAGQAGLFQTE